MNNYELIYKLKNEINESKILGPDNINLKFISELYNCEIIMNFSNVYVLSSNTDLILINNIVKMFSFLENILKENINFNIKDLIIIKQAIDDNREDELYNLYIKKEPIVSLVSGKTIYPKTLNQALYINELNKNDIVFAIGPAGTGKTYLGILYAASLLKKQTIKKIVLVRPVVEAGEKLGFLPGDLKEKVDPYLIPLYDALNECFGKENVTKMMEKGVIEVAPLAYMRGRTLENACIILDEAQNTTKMQMKMFLTRLGFNSKMIITGDITQIDLPYNHMSGLIQALNILKGLNGLSIVKFNNADVMRHPLVFKIVNRYKELDEEKNEN